MPTLFLCGDVMTGRGIDQVLPHPGSPRICEAYAASALDYVTLAEKAHGAIGRPRGFDSVWGDALPELERRRPDARIVNLETAVTTSEDAWPGKGINYRMHPGNVPCLTTARLDACVLANNHVLDWGRAGLEETLATLHAAGIRTAGAGLDAARAAAPAAIALRDGARVLVFAVATQGSGVPADWAAGPDRAGVALLDDLSPRSVEAIASRIARERRPGDIVILSIHWGGNWGYAVPPAHRRFAHALVDDAGVDIVHGHSSHHPIGLEVHRGRLVLYGCGDFINDYEGIGGRDEYRPDLALMYFPDVAADGRLVRLDTVALRMRRFRLERASEEARRWLDAMLRRESGPAAAVLAASAS